MYSPLFTPNKQHIRDSVHAVSGIVWADLWDEADGEEDMADGVAAGVGVTAAGDAEDTEWEVTEDIGSTSSSQIDSVFGNSPKFIILSEPSEA